MNKSELVEAVASGAGVSKAEAERVLAAFFGTVRARLKQGDTVGWPGFGKFATAARAPRTGRNPRTGASVDIAASTAARFSPSSLLKQELNAQAPPKKAGGRRASPTRAAAPTAKAAKAPAKKATTKAAAKKATTKKAAGAKSSR